MNRDQAAQLLRVVQQLDNRTVTDETTELWARMFAHVDLGDAADAVKAHFETSADYLMPVHILRGVKRIAADRAEADRAATADREHHALQEAASQPQRAVEAPTTADPPQDTRRGVRIVQHVLGGLARARRANGGPLGREAAVDLGAILMQEALDRHAGRSMERRGQPCGRTTCRCLHERDPETGLMCDGGWIEIPARRRNQPQLFGDQPAPVDPDAGRVRRCPACDPIGVEIVAKAPGRRAALATLRSRR